MALTLRGLFMRALTRAEVSGIGLPRDAVFLASSSRARDAGDSRSRTQARARSSWGGKSAHASHPIDSPPNSPAVVSRAATTAWSACASTFGGIGGSQLEPDLGAVHTAVRVREFGRELHAAVLLCAAGALRSAGRVHGTDDERPLNDDFARAPGRYCRLRIVIGSTRAAVHAGR